MVCVAHHPRHIHSNIFLHSSFYRFPFTYVVYSHASSESDGVLVGTTYPGRLSKVGPPMADQPTIGELRPDVIQHLGCPLPHVFLLSNLPFSSSRFGNEWNYRDCANGALTAHRF